MKITIDTDNGTLTHEDDEIRQCVPLYSERAFELISQQWLKVGWNQKHVYTFTWMGRPVIQLPHDLVRIQEAVYRIRPDVIIETGVAHGGSTIFYASLCKAMGKGRVIGIDVNIRSHNREAIDAHELSSLIKLIEGDSTADQTVREVTHCVQPGETVLVILDSNHSREHVLAEIEAYSELVSPGSYIVAADGIMRELSDAPRGSPDWKQNNPIAAARAFADSHPEFALEQPARPFSESESDVEITHWPEAWLRRR